jgi:putative nucleotidyltransferase with HDIG domain
MTEIKPLVDRIEEMLGSGEISLPVMDKTSLLIHAEVNKDDPDMNRIEKLITYDQTLTAELLRIANSAFFRGLRKITTVREAMVRLGTDRMAEIVLLMTQSKNFTSRSPLVRSFMTTLWHHSVSCAVGAHWLARESGYTALTHEAFVAGLLHDIGKVFLLRVIDGVIDSEDGRSLVNESLVMEVMDSLHTTYGARLMEDWNLPDSIAEVARDHHDMDIDQHLPLLALIRIIDLISNKLGLGFRKEQLLVPSMTMEADMLGLDDIKLAELEVYLEDSHSLAEAIFRAQ